MFVRFVINVLSTITSTPYQYHIESSYFRDRRGRQRQRLLLAAAITRRTTKQTNLSEALVILLEAVVRALNMGPDL